jgi:hypothetical protein
MALKIRRVVTGHDDNGRAVVTIDEVCKNIMSRRPKHESCVVWSTGSFPADNSGAEDGGARQVATTDPNGTVFRIIPALRRAITAPSRSTTPSSCRGRSTWRSTARLFT